MPYDVLLVNLKVKISSLEVRYLYDCKTQVVHHLDVILCIDQQLFFEWMERHHDMQMHQAVKEEEKKTVVQCVKRVLVKKKRINQYIYIYIYTWYILITGQRQKFKKVRREK